MTAAYIGLGSNLDDPKAQIQKALQALENLPETCLLRHSSLYRSAPVGPQDQPDYINAVALVETAFSPSPLLAELQRIEQAQGRVRTKRWGPRTLDLDLLLFDDLQLQTSTLTLPHPEMHQRAFVLVPLLEIAPDILIPGKGAARALLAALPDTALTPLLSE